MLKNIINMNHVTYIIHKKEAELNELITDDQLDTEKMLQFAIRQDEEFGNGYKPDDVVIHAGVSAFINDYAMIGIFFTKYDAKFLLTDINALLIQMDKQCTPVTNDFFQIHLMMARSVLHKFCMENQEYQQYDFGESDEVCFNGEWTNYVSEDEDDFYYDDQMDDEDDAPLVQQLNENTDPTPGPIDEDPHRYLFRLDIRTQGKDIAWITQNVCKKDVKCDLFLHDHHLYFVLYVSDDNDAKRSTLSIIESTATPIPNIRIAWLNEHATPISKDMLQIFSE